jgi:hypothetical protein
MRMLAWNAKIQMPRLFISNETSKQKNNNTSKGPLQGLRLKFRLSHTIVGGLMISLNSIVPQTSRAKPATCSHLKLSQPRPSETSQMKSVRHVSIVLRAVAEIWRVTDKPKKLKPL